MSSIGTPAMSLSGVGTPNPERQLPLQGKEGRKDLVGED
jgi:hypothetical protein